ncbi:MAG: hypothetical protein HYW50_04740 [Candidatus Diapherotrites archaeon]|nr:hypothetical protein [Candidatus Diapherotrites archaeon]
MASKKKLLKGIKTIERRLKEHEEKLLKAVSEEGRLYLTKDIEMLKKQKKKKEMQV